MFVFMSNSSYNYREYSDTVVDEDYYNEYDEDEGEEDEQEEDD